MSIKNNLLELIGELPSTVKLVAVSKFISNEAIMEHIMPARETLQRAGLRNLQERQLNFRPISGGILSDICRRTR